MVALVAVICTGAAGCSAEPVPEPTAAPASSAEPAPAPSPSVADCLSGRYQVVRLARTSGDGSGEGGDLTATFEAGGFVLTGAGQDPVRVTVSGPDAELMVAGSIRGSYTGAGTTGTYAIAGTDGSAKITAGLLRRTVPMSEVAEVLAPEGGGTLACTETELTMTSSASRVDLRRL